jgi:glycosyltransferase involved in cell wall biosynthesis
MKTDVSIIITAFNTEQFIKRCLQAILKQSYKNFELIIVNDGSKDKTKDIINSFNDERIKLVNNSKNQGIAKSRNIGLKKSKGEYIFFTDSDCMPNTEWLNQGLTMIINKKSDIITGWTLYEDSNPSYSDRIVQGKDVFFTCNLGFKKSAIEKVGGFNEKQFLMYGEDKDLCFRILRNSGIKVYCEDMKVIHQKRLRTINGELKDYGIYLKSKLYRQIMFGKEKDVVARIIRPDLLLVTIFPPILLITKSIRSLSDIKICFFSWLGLIKGRTELWTESTKKGKFYI